MSAREAQAWAVAEEVMAGPFTWGEADCCTAAATVFARLFGADPMAALRGRYRSGAEARALIAHHGGLAELVARVADEAGFRRAWGVARLGDLGLLPGKGDRPGGGSLLICLGRSWAGKGRRGMVLGQRPAATWRYAPGGLALGDLPGTEVLAHAP